MKNHLQKYVTVLSAIAFTYFSLGAFSPAVAAPVPGGSLDPATIPKYVTPLVIPPVMPKSVSSPAPAADYDIAVRQFKQQILPGGIWGGTLPATTVWSYGRATDPLPDSSAIPGGSAGVAPAMNSTFNYPALTIETISSLPTKVRWINDLVDGAGNFLPHLFNVDQTLHWANPPKANCIMMPDNRTDCDTAISAPYTGPVPIVTHVHGAHVQAHSDGYPEAWFLPGAPGTKGIPASYAERGSKFTQADNANTVPGSAFYSYENSQAATTLWYHDHTIGMTRLNVYAGPAGFWLVRGGANGDSFVDNFATPALNDGVLPGPAPSGAGDPNFVLADRVKIREIPIAIQDRSFNSDGSLFFPGDRSFFDGFTGPYIDPALISDISPIWNPESFFNTMVVNGTTWPQLDVAPARYRLRLLDGCNARFLNLALFVVTGPGADGVMGTADDVLGQEIPFYQIGAEQGFLPKVVMIQTGSATPLPGNGTIPATLIPAPDPQQALLMGPAERADVIVDFSGLANGTVVRMINTAPDFPFGGFPLLPGEQADPDTTGQVMQFVVNTTLPAQPSDVSSTPPQYMILPAEGSLGAPTNTRKVSLNELSSDQVCVEIDPIAGTIIGTLFSTTPGDQNFLANCAAAVPTIPGNVAEPMGPRQAVLGVMTTDPLSGNLIATPLDWEAPITETPILNSTEIWEIYNATVDAHPIHVHLVAFQVIDRQAFDPATFTPVAGTTTLPAPNETGYKDTVVALPGQITRIKAKFDIAGLYVWHCHIVDHEDNEMMRQFVVTNDTTLPTVTITAPSTAFVNVANQTVSGTATDPVGIQSVTVNGTAVTVGADGAFSMPLTLAMGSNTITVVATDNSGKQTITTRSVTLSATLPTLILTSPTATFVNKASQTVTGTATGPVGIQSVTVNGTAVTVGAGGAFSTPLTLAPGANTITVVATDNAGNQTTTTRSVTLSTTLPTLTLTSTIAAFVNVANQTVSGTATDPVGIQSVTVNGVAVTPDAAGAFSASVTLVPGANTITVIATDIAGNTTKVTQNVTLDTAAPVSTATPPPGTYAGSVNVSLAANEAATIYYTTDGSTPTTASTRYIGPILLSSPTTKSITLRYFAVDTAGNKETTINTSVYALHTADLTAKVAINNGKGYTNSTSATLSLSASDPAGVSSYAISTDNITYLPTVAINPVVPVFSANKVPVTLPAGDGLKTVYVKFTDALGVVYPPVSAQIILETAPVVVMVTPASGDYGGKITVALSTPNEPEGATIYYTTNGSTPTTASKKYTAPFSLSGPGKTIVVKFFAIDLAGNIGAVQSATYRFVANPDMTTDININNDAPYTNTRNVSLKVSAQDPIGGGVGTMSFSNDGTNFTAPIPYVATKAMPWTLSAGDALKTVYFRFTDKGTPGVAPITYTFTAKIFLAEGVQLATGDVNGDGKVTLNDALKALQASTGVKKLTIAEQARGDVAPLEKGKPKPDGKIDPGDAFVIAMKVIGFISF